MRVAEAGPAALAPSPRAAAVLAVARHELRMLLYAPLSYVFLTGFLAALAAGIFLIADFYASDEASIELMLVFLPWVAMVLVPALAMGTWAGAPGDRGVELAMSLPVGAGPLVLGKFLAGYGLLVLALVFTLPFPATVLFLGAPDPGTLFGGYLGAALLLALFYALSLLAAAVAREAVGAFVLGLASLFILQLLGWEALVRALHGSIPDGLLDVLSLFSPNTWLREMGHGWIALAGLAYFTTLTGAALWLTARVVDGWRAGRSRAPGHLAAGGLAIAGAFLLVAALSRSFGGLDLTEEGEFTPHGGTLEILRRLPHGSEATVYWSESESSVPTAIRSHARRARSLLTTLADHADGRLKVQVIDPKRDSEEEIEAQRNGLHRIPMSSGDSFFLGLSIAHEARSASIAYLDPRRAPFLEYDIALALNNLTRERTPKIGLISPLLPSSVAAGRREGLTFVEELKRAYDIAVIPHFKETLPEGLDALLIIDATILRAEMLRAIDRFVVLGGGLVVLADPFVRFNRASNAVVPSPSPEINDISDLLAHYGIGFRGEAVIGDATLASPVAAEDQTQMSFPFWMRIGTEGLASEHPATADLNEVFLVEPGALEITAPERGISLIVTTEESAGEPREGYGDRRPRELAVRFAPDGQARTLAAVVRGPFTSAFAAAGEDSAGVDHPESAEAPAQVFVVADVDWLFDPFALQQAEIGGRVVTRPLNDNLSLLLNMVEAASGDPALVAIRSRGRLQRPFTRVAAMYKRVEGQLKGKEASLAHQSASLEAQIAGAVQASGVTQAEQLPATVREDITRAYEQLLAVRRDLRQVRRSIRRDIDGLGRNLMIINLVAGPLLVLALALVVRWRRSVGR